MSQDRGKKGGHRFRLRRPNGRELLIEAEDKKLRGIWLEAINKAIQAANGAPPEAPPTALDHESHYEILGLRKGDKISIDDLRRAFRRAAVKCHPDKPGGDVATFELLLEAKDIIETVLVARAEASKRGDILIRANVLKTNEGLGLGLRQDIPTRNVVIRDATKATVSNLAIVHRPPGIQRALPLVESGSIEIGDILDAIGEDKIAGWTMSRVLLRLNEFRVPHMTTISLQVRRTLDLDTTVAAVDATAADAVEEDSSAPPDDSSSTTEEAASSDEKRDVELSGVGYNVVPDAPRCTSERDLQEALRLMRLKYEADLRKARERAECRRAELDAANNEIRTLRTAVTRPLLETFALHVKTQVAIADTRRATAERELADK